MQSLLRASPRLALRSRLVLRTSLRCYSAIASASLTAPSTTPLSTSRAAAMPHHAGPHISPFPTDGLLPKQTSQASAFLEKYPEYDGRNVRVAILDTGVDPAAKGLDGKGKVVEVIDCTGSGDVYLTNVEPLKEAPSGTVALKSPRTGRTLLLASSLKNPSGKWKMGTQAAYALWPRDLVARRKAERKKESDVEAARLGAQVQQAVFEADHGKKAEPQKPEAKEGDAKKAKDGDAKKTAADDADAAKKQKDEEAQKRAQRTEELKAQLSAFKEMAGSFEDAGPIVEVVAWFDGSHWRAIVFGGEGELHDPTLGMPKERLELLGEQTIDLTHRRPMADYGLEHHWEAFGEKDLMTYNVNFLHVTSDKTAEVEAVSIVCNSGSHATHVAGIVSADRKDDPSQNGVAPGCQIVSLCIGDGRLGSMETQQALLRAARAIIDTGCDVANMSFGESGAWGADNKGAFAEQLRDIVIRERDVLFVSSAGNSGPALSTLGQPAGTTTGVLTVGAYVDAGHMQQAQYALVEEGIKSSTTTWCSRGPTFDGAKGVDIYSPGAAVTSIPRYCLQTTMLANGTSMSSPHAAGCVALLVSGMKAKGIPVTPARVFKAIRATAKDVKDPQGVGFFRVADAFDYIVKHADRADADAEWRISVTPAGKPPGRAGTDQRGIYLRNNGTHALNQFTVTAQPTFKQNETERAQALQIGCSLSTTASWVSAPEFVWLGSKGRGFEVRVDTTGLAPGLHVAAVEGYDSESGLKLFECPVTIAKPTPPAPTVHFERVRLDHGKVERRFVSVPIGATWAEMRFRSSNHEKAGTSVRFWNHSVQMLPHARLNEVEKAFVMALNENEPVTKKVSVTGGVPMELCLAQFWASAAGFDLEVTIDWHGISFATPVRGRDETTLIGGEGIARIECTSHVRIEAFSPAISLEQRRSFARPTTSELRPLTSPRDALPDGSTLCELVLTYPLEIKEDSASIKYGLPLSNHLYDSAVPQLSAIFDAHKRRVHFSDVYSDAKAIDLSKGSYTVRVELLAAMPVLEKLRHMSLRVDTKLAKPVSLDVYEDHVDQYGAAKPAKFAGVKLLQGETKVLCLDTNIEGDALPKGVEAGDVLVGTMTASGNEAKGQLRLVVPPAIIKPKPDEGASGETPPTVAELMTGLVQKVPEKERDAYIDRLLKEYPDDLGVLVARLNATKPDDAADASKVLSAAQAILDIVDEQSVLLFAGAKKLPSTEQSAAEKQHDAQQKKRRDAYVLALNRRARALLARDEGKASPDFESTFERYRRVADASDKEFATVYVRWAIQHERYGTALVQVRKALTELGNGAASAADEVRKLRALERELAGEKLGWHCLAANADRARVFESAAGYMPF